MAKAVRRPPAVAEAQQPRAREYFEQSVHDLLSKVGTTTTDVANIAAGAIGTVTITVKGARADEGQGVVVGLPSTFNTGLVPWGYVSADDTVTVVLYNRTGGGIDPPSATYTARVMP